MKNRLLTSLTGIVMSTALIMTGCTGTATGAATSTNTSTAAVQTESAASETEHAEKGADEKKQAESAASETNQAELKTVEPSAYAGQTIYGQVTAVNGSEVTLSLGTVRQKSKKPKTSTAPAAPAGNEAAAPAMPSGNETAAPDMPAGNEAAASDAVTSPSPNMNSAPGKESNSSATASIKGGNGEAMRKGGKSSFKASGEQMTITVPENLAGVQINEGCILSVTLDESGKVSSVEVKSGRKIQSGTNAQKPAGGGAEQDAGKPADDSATLNQA